MRLRFAVAGILAALMTTVVVLLSPMLTSDGRTRLWGGDIEMETRVDPSVTAQSKAARPVVTSVVHALPTTDVERPTVSADGPRALLPALPQSALDDEALKALLLSRGIPPAAAPRCLWRFYEDDLAAQARAELAPTAADSKAPPPPPPQPLLLPGIPAPVSVYMVHYTPMKERRRKMTEMLAKHGVYPEWVLGFDRQVITADVGRCALHFDGANYAANTPVLDRYVPVSAGESGGFTLAGNPQPLRAVMVPATEAAVSERYLKKNRHSGGNPPHRPLLPSQQSVVIKHHSALYRALRRGDAFALILEDDAFLRNGFRARLGEVLASALAADPHLDVLWVGGCMSIHGWRRKYNTTMVTKHLYAKREARCAHAYLVTAAGAAKFLAAAPFTNAIDFQMTSAMRESSARSYWVEPLLSIQGDMGGCVTRDLGAPCVSVQRRYDPAFDLKHINDEKRMNDSWAYVPAFHSRR